MRDPKDQPQSGGDARPGSNDPNAINAPVNTMPGAPKGDTPNSPRAPSNIGTGAASPMSEDADPNAIIAKEQADDTERRKRGEPAKAQGKLQANHPQKPGSKRMRVTAPISIGGRVHQTGELVDLSDEDVTHFGAAVEPHDGKG